MFLKVFLFFCTMGRVFNNDNMNIPLLQLLNLRYRAHQPVPNKSFHSSAPKGTKTVAPILTVVFVGLFLFFSDIRIVCGWQRFLFFNLDVVSASETLKTSFSVKGQATGTLSHTDTQLLQHELKRSFIKNKLVLKNMFKYKWSFLKIFSARYSFGFHSWKFKKVPSHLFKANYQFPICVSHSPFISARDSQGHQPGCEHFPSTDICEKNG